MNAYWSTMDAMKRSLIGAVARYLIEHPAASDSSQGIRQWWLDNAQEATEVQMEAALQWMVSQALIERVIAADGRVRYSRLADARQLSSVEQLLPPQVRH